MSFKFCRTILALSIVFGVSSLAQGDDRFRQVIEVESWGAPKEIGKADHPQFLVWQDEQGWHVHTDTRGKRHEFRITIETVGGRIVEFEDFSGLEGKKKKGKNKDHGKLSDDQRTIKATFVTSKLTDGIDFTVDANTSVVRFHLLINGEERPQWISLGANKTAPPAAAFALAKKKK